MAIYFTKDHEWLRIDGQTGVVGITGYAVEQLGDITFVELPPTGREVKQAEVVCAIESVKAASDIYAPVSGKITEVNQRVESEPEVVNQSPEEDGWLIRLEVADSVEVKGLMSREQYEEYLGRLT